MRLKVILLGIIVGAIGYFISGTIGLVGIILGALLILAGFFKKKKQKMAGQNPQGYRPGPGDAQIMPAMTRKDMKRMAAKEAERKRRLGQAQEMRALRTS